MLSKFKDGVKRGLRLGSRAKDVAPDLSSPRNPSQEPPIVVPVSALPESSTMNDSASSMPLNTRWNASASSLPVLSLITGKSPTPSAVDSDVRPVLDNRNSTMKPKTRTEVYLWSGLQMLWGVLESSAESFSPLKSVIGELKRCIDVYDGTTRSGDDYNELRTKLDSLLGDLSKFVGRPANAAMMANLVDLSSGIQTELNQVLEKQGRTRMQRYSEALDDPDEVIRCYRRINGHLERFTFNSNLSIWETVDQQATDTLIGKLSFATSAMYNSAEATDVRRGPCAPETRQNELEKLRGWTQGDRAHKIYWLNGMAGTGKTTIVYSYCAEIESGRKLGASFFCSRTIPECRNVKHILPSIAYQLASFSSPFRYALSQVLKSDRDVHNRLLKNQFESLIVKPLLEAKHTLSSDLVVVIDALDEFENENSVGQILDLLLGNNVSLPIRFLISSRPEPEIYRRMMKLVGDSLDARLVLHELDQSTVKEDIKTYLTYELEGIPLTAIQLEALIERSGILFIYAATAAGYIKAGYLLMEHEERIDMILGVSPPSSEGKDKYIDELYGTILSAGFNNPNFDRSGRERMGTILNAVVCAREPMTTRALAGLLKLKSGEHVEALLRPLGSVLRISEQSGLVTVLHTSFPDFLFDQQRSTIFYCDFAQVNRILAGACLGIIKHHSPQFNICHIESSYYLDEEIPDMDERVNRAISPELFYSCRHWENHIQLSDKPRELVPLVHDFLSARLLLWIEVLNLKKCLHLGANIMQRIEDWGRHIEVSQELIELAHDAWRFVTMFGSHPISRSTPHIYLSMLPFWPTEAPISLHYASRTRNMVKPIGTALKRRRLALLTTWTFGSQVRSSKFSPDGSRIAVASGKELLVIDGYTGNRLAGPLRGHTNTISSVEFSPDGIYIASASWDGTIRVWGAQTGQMLVGPLVGHIMSVESIHFSPDGTKLVSGSWDTTLRIWDLKTGRTVVGPLEGHIAFVTSVMFSPDGCLIASGSSDKTIRIWEAHTGMMKYGPLKGHAAGVTSIAFSPDGSCLASGSRDGVVRIWYVKTMFEFGIPIEGPFGVITEIQFSSDGQRLVSASEDKTIRVHTMGSQSWRNITPLELTGHTNDVTSVMFSQDGRRILSGSSDNSVRMWDAKTRLASSTPQSPLDGHYNEVNQVRYLAEDDCILSRSIDKVVRKWHPPTYQTGNLDYLTLSQEQSYMVFSSSGRVVSVSSSGVIHVHPADQTTFRAVVDHHALSALAWSSDEEYIASGSGGAVQVWSVRTGQTILDQHTSPPNRITSVGFSPDSEFVGATSGNIVTVWSIGDRKKGRNILEGHTQATTSISFSPNNELIASGSKDATVRVWSLRAAEAVFGPFKGHRAEVTSLAFSPDGARIASSSRDMRICLWDIGSADVLFEVLEGHTGAVLSVAFSHSGKHIISGSSDCTIRVWTSKSETSHDSASSDSFTSWSLTREGWVADSQGRVLLWVPPDLRTSLIMPRNTAVICCDGTLKLDFESTALGEAWVNNFTPQT